MQIHEYINLVKEYSSVGTLFLGSCAFVVACVQINFARKNIRLSACKNEIDIFMKLDEKISDLYESMNEFNSDSADKAVLEARVEQAKQRCFNTFDTICLYVLRGDIDQQNFYRQYGEMILQLSKQELYKRYFTENDKDYYENIQKVVKELKKQNK